MKGQRRIASLVGADRKPPVTQLTTFYNCGEQKNISECWTCPTLKWLSYTSRKPCWVSILPAKNRNLRFKWTKAHQKWIHEDRKNIVWSDGSGFLLRDEYGRVQIWCQQHGYQDPVCLVPTVQAGGGGAMAWGLFSCHTLGSLIPISHGLNATACLIVVSDHVPPIMVTVYHLLMATFSMVMHNIGTGALHGSMNVHLTNLQKSCQHGPKSQRNVSKISNALKIKKLNLSFTDS